MSIFQSKTPTSYNSRLSISLREFFLPSVAQVSLYTLIGTLLLVLLSSGEIWKKISGDYFDNAGFGEIFNHSVPSVTTFINKIQMGRLPLAVFWGLIGCSIYIIIWFIINIINNVRNDIIADSYLQSTGLRRRLFWESVIARKILLSFCVVLVVAYIVVGLKFLPIVANFFYSAISSFRLPVSTLKIIISISIITFLIYLFILLSHLTVNLWRLVYRDL